MRKYSDQQLIKFLREAANQVDGPLTATKYNDLGITPSASLFQYRFGGFKKALIAAGLSVSTYGEDPIETLRNTILDLGYIPKFDDFKGPPSVVTLYFHNFTYLEGIKSAGFDIKKSRHYGKLIRLPHDGIKYCVVCDNPFNAPPSSKKVTCSSICRSIRASVMNSVAKRKWGKRARNRLSKKGKTDNLIAGTAAAQQSPIAGPFETNQNALIWTIMSPEGVTFTVRNLNLWLREHAEMLQGTPEQARAGIMQIKRSMEGKTKRNVSSWKGWRLINWIDPTNATKEQED